MAPSKRTVQFEFQVEADDRQLGRFSAALDKIKSATAVSESVLGGLRRELVALSQTTVQTENGIQAQIAALRDASRNADLTHKEYIKLRTEVGLLEREYKDLTTGIVGVGKAYEQAGRQAEAFNRRAKKIEERQQYINTSQGRTSGFKDEFNTSGTPQVQRNANGSLIAYPATTSNYTGTGDMGLGQFGPSEEAFKAANSLKQAQDQILALNRQYHQKMLEGERKFASEEEAARDEAHQQVLADYKRRADAAGADFERQISNQSRLRQAQQQILEGNRQLYQQAIELEAKRWAQENSLRDEAHQQMLADNQRGHAAAVADFDARLRQRVEEKQALQQQIEDERKLYRQLIEQRDNAFSRRAEKIADRQQYFNTSQGRTGSKDVENKGTAQAQRDAKGNLIGYPAGMSGFERMGDMGYGQYGPSEKVFRAVNDRKQAQDQILAQNRQYHLQMLEGERKFAAEEDAMRDKEHQAMLADSKRRHEAELADFDRRLENRVNSKKQRRSNIRELGNVASGIAIGGFFGGPEGLLGSTVGAGLGALAGPGGMVAGAQLGASAGLAAQQLRMQAAGVADMVAQLNLAKTTLAQVSANQEDYNQKLGFARQVSADYSVGLQTTIEGYAKITAAASANGLTLKETENIYKGLLASGVAFGASQDDLQSIITATTQILSKGKISAEELSGQLGERIPGAVAKFAQATGRPLAQLAKDLQDGKVKIADFVVFAKGQLDDYDAAAKLIGSSPEKAGERLNLALTKMAESYGGFFQTVGSGFQDVAAKFINWISSQERGIKTMVGLFAWAGREIYKFQTNSLAVKALQGLGDFGNNVVKPMFIPPNTIPAGGFPGKAPESNFYADRLREGQQLFPEFKPTLFNQSTSAPILSDLTAADDKAAGRAAKAAEKAAKKAQAEADKATQLQEKLDSEQRRRDELLANNAIRLADRVFQHKMDLLRQEYDLNQQLIDATRAAQEAGMTGVARNMQGTINQILGIYDRLKQGRFNDALDLKLADQQITTERKSAENTARYREVPQSAVGAPIGLGSAINNGVYRQGGWGPGGPNSYGPHYDIARPDGSYFTRNSLDAYVRVNGAPLSRGYTVPGSRGGSFGADRDRGAGAHRAWDYAFGNGAGLTLTGGAKWISSRTGSYGDNTAFMTPDGKIYRLIHGKFEGSVSGSVTDTPARTQPGVTQGINRNIVDTGNVDLATADKKALIEKQKKESQLLFQTAEKQAQTQIQSTTTAYRDQTQALQDQLQDFRERNRLQLEGVKPEIIDQQMQLNKLTRDYTRESETLNNALKGIGERNKDNASLFDTLTNGVKDLTAAYDENRQAQESLNAAENNKRNIFKLDESVKTGLDGYITSIGSLNEAVTGLTQKGFGGLSGAIKDLTTTGTTNFRSFAVNMLSDMSEIIIQQFVVAQLAQMLRNILGGPAAATSGGLPGFGMDQIIPGIFKGAGPIKFANGGVMTPAGPLRLQTYARGGIANSPQLAVFGEGSTPEAYVPLPDGKRIPVAMQGKTGGGDTKIEINIDASGTKAEGDSGKSGALARDLAQVVDARLIHHRRPGGLLAA